MKLSARYALLLLACLTVPALSAPTKCDHGLRQLWETKLRDSPLAATPLLFDVDGDWYNDIVVPSFSGEVWSVHGESGHIVDNWPFYLEDRAFYATPLVHDVNSDGRPEFILATTDGELVFLQSDNTLLHGETIKIHPVRIAREWYQEKEQYLEQLAQTSRLTLTKDKPRRSSHNSSSGEARQTRHADQLFSRHPSPPPSGLDPQDSNFVFVDPHILATPTLGDLDGDGLNDELVVPVSYYFDPLEYGRGSVGKTLLNGLDKEELSNFIAGGVVVIDLKTQTVAAQKVLKLSRANDDQPSYVISSPTVTQLSSRPVIIQGSASGELHVLAADLSTVPGFPLLLDSISSQVAVADLFHTGTLYLVVGDHSGNVYCIDETGRRLWEQETDTPIISSPRFMDLNNDNILEVVLLSQEGDLWVLNGRDGSSFSPDYPLHFKTPVQGPPLLLHLNTTAQGRSPAIVLPTSEAVYVIDALTACIDKLDSEHMFMDALADDIDPYSPGIELLAISLDGHIVCYSTGGAVPSPLQLALESWSGDSFTHKSNSFALILPTANNSVRDVSSATFKLDLQIYQAGSKSQDYLLDVRIGRGYTLYRDTLTVRQNLTSFSLTVLAPSEPMRAFITVELCDHHQQCSSQSHIVNFNLNFEENLKWLLCLPFMFLCALLLWVFREEGSTDLPLAMDTRKTL